MLQHIIAITITGDVLLELPNGYYQWPYSNGMIHYCDDFWCVTMSHAARKAVPRDATLRSTPCTAP